MSPHGRQLFIALNLSALFIFLCSGTACATTKGLNQIVTPDIQTQGELSLSVQQQDPNIGNRLELQAELGITKQFEIAVFQGSSPGEEVGNAELGIIARGPYLLSTGFLSWTTKGGAPEPFLEAGYYRKRIEIMIGAIDAPGQDSAGAVRYYRQTQAILGAAFQVDSRLLAQIDYQSGSNNFSTAGFTYSIAPQVTFNPAVYLSNSSPHIAYGYAVLTWSIQAFK
jgi:hypothetical protein